tara:strand:+ start:49 stop:945 length:897 start_codon:yes stop_codon:yes gene_type:complete
MSKNGGWFFKLTKPSNHPKSHNKIEKWDELSTGEYEWDELLSELEFTEEQPLDEPLISITLHEVGQHLQKIHFPNIMRGYETYLNIDGGISSNGEDSAVILRMERGQVRFLSKSWSTTMTNVTRNNKGEYTPAMSSKIASGERSWSFRYVNKFTHKGWPYVAEIRHHLEPKTHCLAKGNTHKIGRSKHCAVTLPDTIGQDNIIWRETPNASTLTRTGSLAKHSFYTDSIMVASEHLEIDTNGTPKATNLSEHCFSWLRRGEDMAPLFPLKKEGPRSIKLKDGDELLVGNTIFLVKLNN